MSSPLVHAFFIGRALAEAISEQVENLATNALSELGKFDAEQRERLRQFTEEVMERARRAEDAAAVDRPVGVASPARVDDLQTMIDDLRAETAQLRVALQQYRNQGL